MQTIRGWWEGRRRNSRIVDAELRDQQEDAEQRLGIDPGDLGAELDAAESAPFRRGLLVAMVQRQAKRRRR
jgi:hypothetical protein